jgi:pyridoxamine 5'-phosphate oxidase
MSDRSPFDPNPLAQFEKWLAAAVDPQPRAMVLSTVDELGHPDARVVMLRGVSAAGWSFSSSASSPKGGQLARRPSAALTWYWPAQGRQIRARGEVFASDGTSDFLARPPDSRAEVAIGSRQSTPLADPADLTSALATADVETAPPDWTRYELRPSEVQFFQLEADRAHVRIRYDRTDSGWTRTPLWP